MITHTCLHTIIHIYVEIFYVQTKYKYAVKYTHKPITTSTYIDNNTHIHTNYYATYNIFQCKHTCTNTNNNKVLRNLYIYIYTYI